MAWRIDGRNGVVNVAGTRLHGIALMRDAKRRVIAFDASPDERSDPPRWDLLATHQFVIEEDAFEPKP